MTTSKENQQKQAGEELEILKAHIVFEVVKIEDVLKGVKMLT